MEMELEVWMASARKAPSPCPTEWVHIARMKVAGVVVSWLDFDSMPALLREDLISWGIAERNVLAEAQD